MRYSRQSDVTGDHGMVINSVSLLPALVIEGGHNAQGLPVASLLAGGALAAAVSSAGRHLLRRFSLHTT